MATPEVCDRMKNIDCRASQPGLNMGQCQGCHAVVSEIVQNGLGTGPLNTMLVDSLVDSAIGCLDASFPRDYVGTEEVLGEQITCQDRRQAAVMWAKQVTEHFLNK